MCELCLLFGHTLSHLKFEIHVVMHLSAAETANALSKYQLVKSNVLALKGDGRWHSHWFLAGYAQENTPTEYQPILDLRRAQSRFISPS